MRIELFRITHCGFYRRAQRAACFGDLSESLVHLRDWVGRAESIVETSTFEDAEQVPARVYCVDCLDTGNGGVGLTLWSEAPTSEQGVAYIAMTDKPGQVSAAEQPLPRNSIAGWPNYFWIWPAQSLMIALVPSGGVRLRGTGVPQARRYLQSYLHAFSSFAVFADPVEGEQGCERRILGWRGSAQNRPDPSLRAKFLTRPVYLPGPLDEIRQRRGEIRKLVSSMSLHRDVPDRRTAWEQALQLLHWDSYRLPDSDHCRFRWEIDWQPTDDELEAMIARWQDRSARVGDELGVKFSGDSTVHWFGRAGGTDHVALDGALEHAPCWSAAQFRTVCRRAHGTVERLLELEADGGG